MKVIILGGNGFIGTNLSKYLLGLGYKVVVFDVVKPEVRISGIDYIIGNFFEESEIIPYLLEVDIVVHAISLMNPGNSNSLYMQGYNNEFLYSVMLADYSLIYNFKLIFLSSGGTVYGEQKVMPISEDAVTAPINHYGNIKLCIENTYRTFHIQAGADIKIVRIANPYGAGQNYLKGVGLIDAVLKCALQNRTVNIYGDGSVIRDYIYIDDVCGMIEKVINYNGSEMIFNIGTGTGVSQKQITDYVKDFVPELRIVHTPSRHIDVPCIILNNTKIMELYQKECISVKDGISKYYNYIKEEMGKLNDGK